MHAMPSSQDLHVASDAQLQRHDLMIELYRLDQASVAARRQERNDDVARIDRARQRLADVLGRLPA